MNVETMTNGQLLDILFEGSDIRFMTYVLLITAPEPLFNKWNDALQGPKEYPVTQMVWRVACHVARALESRGESF